MAKGVNDKKRSAHQKSGKADSSRKKARVEVTYDNGSAPPKSAPSASHGIAGRVKVEAEDAEDAAVHASTTPVLDKGKAKAIDQSAQVSPIEQGTFVVIAGSYEKLLYGLEGSLPSPTAAEASDAGTSAGKVEFQPIFIFPAHLACVKAVAASPGGKWLATGSEDEFVKVWDLRRRREMGSLSQHTGSITSLHFPSSSHLVSTSVDGTIALFRTSDWACLKALKGHSGRVNHVDVHPTGRVALSVGKDMTLKMWDLMRGRGASSLALGSEAEMVKFSPLGTHFAVLFPKKVELYSLTLKLLQRIETKSRFNTLDFARILAPAATATEDEGAEREVLCIGTEKGVVEVRSVIIGGDDAADDEDGAEQDVAEASGKDGGQVQPTGGAKLDVLFTLVGHTNRIKSLSTLSQPVVGPDSASVTRTTLLSTASSDGHINVYNLSAALSSLPTNTDSSTSEQVQPVASYDTKGSRLTCVFLADGKRAKGGQSANNKPNGMAAEGDDAKVDLKNEADGDDDEDEQDGDEDEDDQADMYDQDSEGDDEDADNLEGVAVEFENDEEEEEEEAEDEDEVEGEEE